MIQDMINSESDLILIEILGLDTNLVRVNNLAISTLSGKKIRKNMSSSIEHGGTGTFSIFMAMLTL